jgi:hypothetical protein
MQRRRAEDADEAKVSVSVRIDALLSKNGKVGITNDGRATARNFKAHLELSQNTFPGNKRVTFFESLDIERDELPGVGPNTIDPTIVKQVYLPKIDWPKLIRREEVLVVTGILKYDNGFERIIRDNSFCAAVAIQPGVEAAPPLTTKPQPPVPISIQCSNDGLIGQYNTWPHK